MTKSSDRPLLEAVLENSEVVADTFVSEEVLKDIPFVGTAVKLCKAANTIRDRVFAAKLQKFIMGLECDPEIAAKWRAKVDESPEKAAKVGETLLLVLDRLIDLHKAELLAIIFVAYVDNVIDLEDLRRIAQAIDVAYFDDLIYLLGIERNPKKSADPRLLSLTSSGLTSLVVEQTIGDLGSIYYEISELGTKFRKTYTYKQQKHKP